MENQAHPHTGPFAMLFPGLLEQFPRLVSASIKLLPPLLGRGDFPLETGELVRRMDIVELAEQSGVTLRTCKRLLDILVKQEDGVVCQKRRDRHSVTYLLPHNAKTESGFVVVRSPLLAIWRHLEPGPASLLLMMMSYGAQAYPAVETLAARLGVSNKSVSRWLGYLRTKNLVLETLRFRDKARRYPKSSLYEFVGLEGCCWDAALGVVPSKPAAGREESPEIVTSAMDESVPWSSRNVPWMPENLLWMSSSLPRLSEMLPQISGNVPRMTYKQYWNRICNQEPEEEREEDGDEERAAPAGTCGPASTTPSPARPSSFKSYPSQDYVRRSDDDGRGLAAPSPLLPPPHRDQDPALFSTHVYASESAVPLGSGMGNGSASRTSASPATPPPSSASFRAPSAASQTRKASSAIPSGDTAENPRPDWGHLLCAGSITRRPDGDYDIEFPEWEKPQFSTLSTLLSHEGDAIEFPRLDDCPPRFRNDLREIVEQIRESGDPVVMEGDIGCRKTTFAAAIAERILRSTQDSHRRASYRIILQGTLVTHVTDTTFVSKNERTGRPGDRQRDTRWIEDLAKCPSVVIADDWLHKVVFANRTLREATKILMRKRLEAAHVHHLVSIFTTNLPQRVVATALGPDVTSRLYRGVHFRCRGADSRGIRKRLVRAGGASPICCSPSIRPTNAAPPSPPNFRSPIPKEGASIAHQNSTIHMD